MSSNNILGQEASVEEQTDKQGDAVETVPEEPELRRSVEQEIQGKVDTNHPDARRASMTLEAEERFEAREREIERTRRRLDSRQDSSREARTCHAARQGSTERRREFQRRAAGVDPVRDPDTPDPRARLTREELGAVNEEAARLAARLDGWTTSAVSRRLAERVAAGEDLTDVSLSVFEECLWAAGQVIPIAAVEDVDRGVVSVEGEIQTLWEPAHPAIQQVGLIADGTDRIKFTSWVKSQARLVQEGQQVRMYGLNKNWYQGRCSVAVTYWSCIEFSERGRWWE